jgi:cation diffusion facilitator CzcD-associated flavoprotein CzcO
MRYSELPVPSHAGSYATAGQFHAYLTEVAASLGLARMIHLRQEVTGLARDGDSWSLAFASRPPHRCRHVLVATGLNSEPVTSPPVHSFRGTVTHSRDYRHPRRFASARVLVVGGGNSGAEIASEIAGVAASVDLAVARPFHVVPREVMGFACDRLDGPLTSRLPLALRQVMHDAVLLPSRRRARRAGLASPRAPLLRSAWTISSDLVGKIAAGTVSMRPWPSASSGSRVTFADGSAGDFDHIVLATGYEPAFPALPAAPPVTRTQNGCYLKIVPHECEQLPGVYFIGFLLPLGALLPVVEAQARWVARALAGAISLPSRTAMRRLAEADREKAATRFSGTTASSMLVDPYPYIRHLDRQR